MVHLKLKMSLESWRHKLQQVILHQASLICFKVFFLRLLNLMSHKFVFTCLSFLLKNISLYVPKMWLYKALEETNAYQTPNS